MKKPLIMAIKVLVNILLIFCLLFIASSFSNNILLVLILAMLIIFNVKIKFKKIVLVVLMLLCLVYIFIPKKRSFCSVVPDRFGEIVDACQEMKCIGIPYESIGSGVCYGKDLEADKFLIK